MPSRVWIQNKFEKKQQSTEQIKKREVGVINEIIPTITNNNNKKTVDTKAIRSNRTKTKNCNSRRWRFNPNDSYKSETRWVRE